MKRTRGNVPPRALEANLEALSTMEVAEYSSDLLSSLQDMAEKHGLHVLARLLGLAREEATLCGHR